MQITQHIGLVLEGGGMRGVFTAGVLDAFMKYEVYFPYVVAVSAGALHGLSYMSHQPEEIIPFDYKAYEQNPATFEMVTTNCQTGRAMYLSERFDHHRITQIAKASSALPFVSQVTFVDHIPMLDGGIVDSIPIVRSIDMGHHENVVVLTRNRGYRSTEPDIKMPKFVYKEFPRLRVALSRRTEEYNRQLDLIERMEDWGEIIVIRPECPLEVGRITQDVVKLERLYEEGFQLGERFCNSLNVF